MRVTVWAAAGLLSLLYAQADLGALWAERDNPEKAEKAVALLEAQQKEAPPLHRSHRKACSPVLPPWGADGGKKQAIGTL